MPKSWNMSFVLTRFSIFNIVLLQRYRTTRTTKNKTTPNEIIVRITPRPLLFYCKTKKEKKNKCCLFVWKSYERLKKFIFNSLIWIFFSWFWFWCFLFCFCLAIIIFLRNNQFWLTSPLLTFDEFHSFFVAFHLQMVFGWWRHIQKTWLVIWDATHKINTKTIKKKQKFLFIICY